MGKVDVHGIVRFGIFNSMADHGCIGISLNMQEQNITTLRVIEGTQNELKFS